MKKGIITCGVILGLALTACSSGGESADTSAAESLTEAADTSAGAVAYKDGTYTGESDKDEHGGMIRVTIEIKDSAISTVTTENLDGEGKEKGEEYGKETNNEGLYKKAQDSVAGMAQYGPALESAKDISKVDVVSGATQSYEAFKVAVNRALESAK